MKSPGNDLQRRFRCRSQRAARPKFTADTASPPRVILPVCPDETGRVCELPAAGAAVHVVNRVAVGVVGVTFFWGEKEAALPLPVGGCDEAGDYGWGVFGSAAVGGEF